LLFENDEPNAAVKITDFGLSKLMTGKRQFLDSRCGTPAYVAPEILLGEQYGPKVDLWAVGVITYLLLAGYPPFWGDTMEELFDRIIDADFAFHAQYWSSVSNEGMHFVEQLLEPKVSKRYSATDALKHPWIVKAKPKMPSLSSMYGLRAYRNNRQATANETYAAQRAAAEGAAAQAAAATAASSAAPSSSKDLSGSSFTSEDDSEKDPTYDPSATGAASTTAAPPVDLLADSRVLDSWKHFLDETKKTRRAVGASLESSVHAEARERQLSGRSEVPLAPLLSMASSVCNAGEQARVQQKYPRWPDYNETFYRGRLTGTFDTSQVLEELAKPSRWKDRAMELGYIRPFLMLVSMHPLVRLTVANSLGVDIISKIWYGDAHHEAWDIINLDKKGMRARTVRIADKALKELLGITCWFDTMWRVTEKTLSHRKTAVDLKAKVADYNEFLSNFGRDALIAACKSGPQIDVVENLETEWFVALLRRLHEFRSHKGRGATSVPQLFAKLDDIRESSGAALHMLENFEMAGIRAESLILFFANYYFGERYMKDADEGTFQLWLQKERQATASSVLLGKLEYGVLMPAVFLCLFQRTILGASGVPLLPFYPDSRSTL
jgi:Protein kinase domain